MPGLRAEGKRQGEQAQGGMGVDVVRLGEPALVHAYRHLRVRALFRVPGCRRPRARPGRLGLCDRRGLAGRRADGAGAGRDCRCGGTAQAMGSCLLGALCRRCGRSLGRGAGARRSDRDPGFSRDRTDRSRVYGVFTNAALPALGGREEIGRISGSGWALGYWGGLASLALVLGLIAPVPGSERTVIGLEPILGLDPGRGEGARAVGPLSALWYIVFVVPFFLWTPDAPRRPGASNAVATGLRELKRTLAAASLAPCPHRPARPQDVVLVRASRGRLHRRLGQERAARSPGRGLLHWTEIGSLPAPAGVPAISQNARENVASLGISRTAGATPGPP